jgi:alanine racemase
MGKCVLTIDMASIRHNLDIVSRQLNNTSVIAGVIKANAYGMGYIPIGLELYANGCRHFFVASVEEGIAVRLNLPTNIFIYVLGGTKKNSEQYYIDHQLTPVVVSYEALSRWRDFLISRSSHLSIAIKLNTGMNRFGFDERDVDLFCSQISKFNCFSIKLVMSHLACADAPHHPLNHIQLSRFVDFSNRISQVVEVELRSLANSSGIFLGSDFHFDMVRPGAALYGINPQPRSLNPLRNAVSFKLPLRLIRRAVSDGDVGYGATLSISAGDMLAVVAGGYADGIHTAFGRQFEGRIHGVSVPTCGRISMDATTFDVTNALSAGNQIADDDYIHVIDSTFTLDYWMNKTNSLGYEILTSFGDRIERCYINKRVESDE